MEAGRRTDGRRRAGHARARDARSSARRSRWSPSADAPRVDASPGCTSATTLLDAGATRGRRGRRPARAAVARRRGRGRHRGRADPRSDRRHARRAARRGRREPAPDRRPPPAGAGLRRRRRRRRPRRPCDVLADGRPARPRPARPQPAGRHRLGPAPRPGAGGRRIAAGGHRERDDGQPEATSPSSASPATCPSRSRSRRSSRPSSGSWPARAEQSRIDLLIVADRSRRPLVRRLVWSCATGCGHERLELVAGLAAWPSASVPALGAAAGGGLLSRVIGDFLTLAALMAAVLLVDAVPRALHRRVIEGERTFLSPVLAPVERVIYRVGGDRRTPRAGLEGLRASRCSCSASLRSPACYVVLRLQDGLPLNPTGVAGHVARTSPSTPRSASRPTPTGRTTRARRRWPTSPRRSASRSRTSCRRRSASPSRSR